MSFFQKTSFLMAVPTVLRALSGVVQLGRGRWEGGGYIRVVWYTNVDGNFIKDNYGEEKEIEVIGVKDRLIEKNTIWPFGQSEHFLVAVILHLPLYPFDINTSGQGRRCFPN